MTTPRHRIRRQILEVTIEDRDSAWSLQSELSRIQSRSLEAIIDRSCTEAGDPDRIHRIERLEVDLGRIDADKLERDLIEKLGPRLREALAARIRREDEATALQGGEPEMISRLELVAFFARSGHLPWWADASRPRLLDETVGLLLQRAARPLVALMRMLARERGGLRRIVLNCEDERLAALFGALVASSPLGLAERPAELGALLRAHHAVAGATPGRFRSAVWLAVLRAACIEETGSGGAVSFWREALAHVALELGVTYASLLTGLHESREPTQSGRPDPFGVVAQSLLREIRGEAPTSASSSHGEEPAQEAAETSLQVKVLAEARRLLQQAIEEVTTTTATASTAATASTTATASARSGEAEEPDKLAPEVPISDAGEAGEIEQILSRLERLESPLKGLLAELRVVVRRALALRRGALLQPLRELDRQAPTQGHDAPKTRESVLRALRQILQAEASLQAEAGLREGEAPAEWEVAGQAWRLLQQAVEEATSTTATAGTTATATATATTTATTTATAMVTATATARSGADEEPDKLGPEVTFSDAGEADEIELILSRLERLQTPLKGLFAELRVVVRRAPAPRRGALLEPLRELDRQALARGHRAPATGESLLQVLRQIVAQRWLPADVLQRCLQDLQRKEWQREELPLDLSYGDSDEVYVENAGLVVLWPFLGHLFERLGLMAEKRFKDRDALHRAVGLLQHLATEDLDPPEYQLPLAKVLCGMKMTEVFDFGPPVTEVEAEECTNLLAAAIANAPILRDMSIAGFRGSFLLRKGVLSARDDAWLLRVERASYDVVLDRFPWGISWVKLPWMEAPLCVEW